MKYHCLTEYPNIPFNIVEEAKRATYEIGRFPNLLKAGSSFNHSPVIKSLRKRFGDTVGGIYVKNSPWSFYDWHIDMNRKCSINWLLKTNPNARTLYRQKTEPERLTSIIYNIFPIEYVLYKPTIMETTTEHCVINPSDEERIIFSVSLDVPFDDVKEFFNVV
jgi:hypothetical protein